MTGVVSSRCILLHNDELFLRLRYFTLRDGFCLIYQHDGDIVPDFIEEFAVIANESISLFIQVDFPFAFWAGEDIEQLFAYCHFHTPSSDGMNRINLVSSCD
jgi:hypothetical protein